MKKYKQIAKLCPIFQNLTEVEADSLIQRGKLLNLRKKETLFHHGDILEHFYIICSGSIQIFRNDPDGNEKTLNILTAKDIICDSGIFDQDCRYQYNATAVDEMVILAFSKAWLKENIKNYGGFALSLLAILSRKNQIMEVEFEQRITMRVEQIVICFLQKLCLAYSLDPSNFQLPYSKKLIASRLGITVETLSRTFQKLKEYGVSVSGSNISIADIEFAQNKLCTYCSVEDDCNVRKDLKRISS